MKDKARIDAFAVRVRYVCGLMTGEGDFADEPLPSHTEWMALMAEAEAISDAMQEDSE